MTETSRIVPGLRDRGWTDIEIADFMLRIETGDEKYRPKREK